MRNLKQKYNIGIDVGGTSIKLGIIDSKGELVGKKLTAKTSPQTKQDDFLDCIAKMVNEALETNKIRRESVNSIGICVPGWVRDGYWVYCNSIPECSNLELTKDVASTTEIKTYAVNDAKAAAVAEYEHRKCLGESMLYFIIGTGIGGAYIDKKGKLFESDHGYNFEVGHTITNHGKEARQCNCGKKGCFEAHASSISLEKMAKENFDWDKSCKEIYELAIEGNDTADKLVEWQVEQLAIGIVNTASIIDCKQIVISGAMSKDFDFIKERLYNKVDELKLSPEIKYSITKAEVQDGGILGAAALYKQYDKFKDLTLSAKKIF